MLQPEKFDALAIADPSWTETNAAAAEPLSPGAPQSYAQPVTMRASSSSMVAPLSTESYLGSTAAQSLKGHKEMGSSLFGSGRRMVLELKDSIRDERRNRARELDFTLDCVSASVSGDPDIRLPRYLPYYDANQVLFLKSPER